MSSVADEICWHGMLRVAAFEPAEGSQPLFAANSVQEAQPAVSELIGLLAEYNLEINGKRPSDQGGHAVERRVAYSLAEILAFLVTRAREDGRYWPLYRGLAVAWAAVLAGDIDDIRLHVRITVRAEGAA